MPEALLQSEFQPERVLIVLPTWVGDFVMATPILRAIRERFSVARISWVAEPNLRDLIDGAPGVSEVAFWPAKSERKPWSSAYRHLVRRLRGQGFALAVLLPNSFRSALLAWQAGAKRRVGFDRDGRGMFLTDRVISRNIDPSAGGRRWFSQRRFQPYPLVDHYHDLALALGCRAPGDRLELFTSPEAEASTEAHLQRVGLAESQPLIVISPGAKYGAAKCWAPERFAGVADRLVREQGAGVVVTCGPGEEHIAQAIHEAMEEPAAVFDEPRLSLAELKCLVRRSDLLLCNDAGPRHFAKAFDVPVVTVFGPTHPGWTATSYPLETIVRVEVPCGPCQQRICPEGHLRCMTEVTVDMVASACQRFLQADKPLQVTS